MAEQIIKQPNGKYAVWSTIVDGFTMLDAAPEQIIAARIAEAVEEIGRTVDKIVGQLERGEKPYFQFTLTWEEALSRNAEREQREADNAG